MTHYPIAIVGGGLGGLTLACILQKHGLAVAVFEGESSRHARSQGGSLDLHKESGQHALHEAGLYDAFLAVARPEGQAMRVLDKHARLHWDETATPGEMARPEIDRAVLRDLLLDALQPGTVRWGHRLQRLTAAAQGGYELVFNGGATCHASLVVGADGAWSRVRPLLTEAQPVHAGVNFVEIGLPDAAQQQPEIARLVGMGKMMALHDNKGLIAQYNGDGRIRVYVALRTTETWLEDSGIPFDQPKAARRALLGEFQDWSPTLTALIEYCDDSFIPRPLHVLPKALRWDRRPGLTLLGDAAHLMSPFAGEGANIAMHDAAQLAHALIKHADRDTAIAEYETDMFERADAAAHISNLGLETCIAPDGANRLAAMMAGFANQV